MARDGSGNASRVVTPPSNGDVANATDFNSEMNDVYSMASDSINKAGTKAFAANQPMGGFKLTGLAAGANAGESVRYEQVLPSVFQGLDATLTALAALSWSSGSPLLQFTAADTVSLTLTPSVTSIALGAGAVNAPSLVMGGDTTTGIYRSAANTISFTINGTLRMLLASGGLDLSATTTPIKLNAGAVGTPMIVVRGADTTTGIYSIGTGNWGFASGGVLAWDYNGTRALFAIDAVLPTAAPTSQLSAGYRGLGDQPAKTADYTFVAADEGKAIDHNSASTHTFTHNTGIVDKRQFISGMNLGAGALTIARGAGVTYRDAAGTNANLTVNQYQRYSILGTDTAETFSVRVF